MRSQTSDGVPVDFFPLRSQNFQVHIEYIIKYIAMLIALAWLQLNNNFKTYHELGSLGHKYKCSVLFWYVFYAKIMQEIHLKKSTLHPK